MTHTRIHYATHCDRTYLPKLMCLLSSMKQYTPGAIVHVLAFDQFTHNFLFDLALIGLELDVFRLADIEDAPLLAAKQTRTWQEYCWTLSSVWLRRVTEDFPYDPIVYLDADTFFFASPDAVFAEIGTASVAIVPHRLAPVDEERFSQNGKYNANFVYVAPNAQGHAFVHEWADLCVQWCFYRAEDGKFADQGYLDTLVPKHSAHIIQHKGINLAPWSQLQYNYMYSPDFGLTLMNDPDRGDQLSPEPLVLYHFHEFRDRDFLTGWPLHPLVRKYVYQPYIELFERTNKEVEQYDISVIEGYPSHRQKTDRD